jgi:hypothetical protein
MLKRREFCLIGWLVELVSLVGAKETSAIHSAG